MTKTETNVGFENLGIAPKLLEILQRNKFKHPTPIQFKSIPIAIQGKDIMGIAQTGTGKTLAFGIPMLQRLAQSKGEKKGLVLLPTRELAIQVDENLKKIGVSLGLRTAVLIGGESMHKQLRMLRQNPHIIVATPGRLNDHMDNSKLSLHNVGVLVLDEADHMLDMGFAPQIQKIISRIPKQRQTMLFSATMPDEIVKLANSHMHMPLRVEVTPPGTAVKTVTQELYFIERGQKNSLLKNILTEYNGSVLVFSKTKHKARDVARLIRNMGHSAAEIHSNRSQGQRRDALSGFKIGKYRILVATDIAARGIDVSGIQLVVNYDLPATADDYVHRIGRTGRAGMPGHAISFATHDQKYEVKKIERLIKKTLVVAQAPANLEREVKAQKNNRYEKKEFKPNHRREKLPARKNDRSLRDFGTDFPELQPVSRTDNHKPQRGFKRANKNARNRKPISAGPSRPGLFGGEGGYFMQRRKPSSRQDA